MDRDEELADLEEIPEMTRGYPIFMWKEQVLEDSGSHPDDENVDILNVHGDEEDIAQHEEHEENNAIIDYKEDHGTVDFEEQVDVRRR